MKYTSYSQGNKKICAGKNEEKMKGEEGKREKGKKGKRGHKDKLEFLVPSRGPF